MPDAPPKWKIGATIAILLGHGLQANALVATRQSGKRSWSERRREL